MSMIRVVGRLGPRRLHGSRLLVKAQRRAATDDDAEEEVNVAQLGIEQFVGTHVLEKGFTGDVPDPGRSWLKTELEGKSYVDLRRVWFILLKERNQLLSLELFHQHQEETLGPFPHPGRLDRVTESMRRVKEVMADRHLVAKRVAWDEFTKRVGLKYYRFPAGPQPPAEIATKERVVTVYAARRVIPQEEQINQRGGVDEMGFQPPGEWEALRDRLNVVLDVDVEDVKERLTAEGEQRKERRQFLVNKLRSASRDLRPLSLDLIPEWRAERDALYHQGPWRYDVTLKAADAAQSLLRRAEDGEDQVMHFSVLAAEAAAGQEPAAAGPPEPLLAAFASEDQLLFSGEVHVPESEDDLYKHVLAREEWSVRRNTRPAPVTPFPFNRLPDGVDPFLNERRSAEHNVHQVWMEYAGADKVRYIDAPHKGTRVINRLNAPGESAR